MTRRAQTKGKCNFCGKEMTSAGMARHLSFCPQRQKAIHDADRKSRKTEKLMHLRVRDAWDGDYWLHLEMRGSAPLDDLDSYLRTIWLECCEHLSAFFAGGRYAEEIPFEELAGSVFGKGIELTHIYDFGTESQTLIQPVGMRDGKPLTEHPIFLMARNNPPEMICGDCDEPASLWCFECAMEYDGLGAVCEKHAKSHPCAEYAELIPIPNSPRLGLCGYDGPAEPPY